MTTILICEKPDAAKKIAYALADKPKHVKSDYGIVYYKFELNGMPHIAVSAVGHIFGLRDTSGKGWTYPVFDCDWAPTFEIDKGATYIKKYYETLKEVAQQGTDFIIATDLDEEGSVIGYNVLRFIFKKESAQRMEFSTLTKQDLQKAYSNLSKKLDFSRIESGLTRHELDFLWGINISRALTLSIKEGGKLLKFHVLSAGRVQTPMLHFLINKEREIAAFKSTPFWELYAHILSDPRLTLTHINESFWEKEKALVALKNSENQKALVKELTKKQIKKSPPHPFDLTTLQTEAYRFFGYAPKRTIEIAQKLYTAGHISYPRTSSQKLPPSIGYKEILLQLKKIPSFSRLSQKLLMLQELKPNEGKKEDAAHPAVYPTTEIPDIESLDSTEQKLYDLIVRRFMATFADEAVRESNTILFDIGPEEFKVTGSRTIEKNWMEFYGKYAKFEEIELPSMSKGQTFDVEKLEMLDKETQPPPRYSQGSIVKELESVNLGTKTTRAMILQTLYDRGYIEDKSIKVTSLGMKVGESLEKYVPDITSEELTRNFEKETEKVSSGEIKRSDVIEQARKLIEKISLDFKKHQLSLGRELEEAVIETKDKQNLLGPCPECGKLMRILYSPKTKKKFVGCSGYPECKKGFPLPGMAKITYEGKSCELCKSSIIKVIRKGKRPFNMCLDPSCKSKENWGKKKEEKEITK